jgi:hypothetical protein
MSLLAPSATRPGQIPGESLPPAAYGEMLRANLRADFAFFRRSRLLLAFGLVFLLLIALIMMPTFFSNSGVGRFNVLREIFDTMTFFVQVLSGGLGLLVVSSHLRNRSLKMVFTKPCPPGLWLASAFLSSALVSLALTAGVLLASIGFSLWWHLPVRLGLLYLSLHSFVTSLIVIAYLLLLGTLMHPAVAVTLIIIFNNRTFFSAQEWAQTVIRAGNSHLGIRVLEKIFHVVYFILPIYVPFDDKTQVVATSYRAGPAAWKYLLYSSGYALLFWAFCYFAALLALKKRRHI